MMAMWQNTLCLPNLSGHTWRNGLISKESKVLPLSGQQAPRAGRGMPPERLKGAAQKHGGGSLFAYGILMPTPGHSSITTMP